MLHCGNSPKNPDWGSLEHPHTIYIGCKPRFFRPQLEAQIRSVLSSRKQGREHGDVSLTTMVRSKGNSNNAS